METHRGQATPEAGAAALAYGRLMGTERLGHEAAARRAIIEALRTVAGLETVLAATGNPNGEFSAAGGGCFDAEHDTVLVRAPHVWPQGEYAVVETWWRRKRQHRPS